MGLLDGLLGSSGGGLLDFLRNNAMNQQFGSGLQSDQAQYGQPMQAMAQMPTMLQPAMPQQPLAPPQQPLAQQPMMSQPATPQQSGGLGAGLSGFINNLHTGPIGALVGGLGSAAGLTDGKTAIAREKANTTAAYLRSKGVPEVDIAAAVGNGRVSGDENVMRTLLARYGNQEKVRPATAEERKAFGAPEDLPMSIDTTTGKPSYGPAGQKTNVSLSTVANPVIKGVGEQLVAQRETARTAARQTIPFVHDARQALDEGAITGQFADQKVFFTKVAGLFGLPTDAASNTEVFRSAIGNQVLAHIKALGANPSNADRDYIEKIQGGQVSLEESSLRKLLDMTEKYARQSIQNFNSDAQRLVTGPKAEQYQEIAPLMNFPEPGPYQFKRSASQPSTRQESSLAPANASPMPANLSKLKQKYGLD